MRIDLPRWRDADGSSTLEYTIMFVLATAAAVTLVLVLLVR